MNITRYMKNHESSVNEQLLLKSNRSALAELKMRHERVLSAMQHERLIHLIVTLAFALFLLITIAIALITPHTPVLILSGLFFITLIPYIAHYFFLENTIQRWYLLSDKIASEINSLEK